MSIESHISTISKKREQIKQRIASEMAHPSPDFGLISRLKKQNLMLKEEMQHYMRRMDTAVAS